MEDESPRLYEPSLTEEPELILDLDELDELELNKLGGSPPPTDISHRVHPIKFLGSS